jgi:hypothetical protein
MADEADVEAAHLELREAGDAIQRLLGVADLTPKQLNDARDRLARAHKRVNAAGPLRPGPGPGSPKFTISPDAGHFGSWAVGQTSPPVTFTVKNIGNAPSQELSISPFNVVVPGPPLGPDPEFSVLNDTCTGKILGVLEAGSFAVTFHPTQDAVHAVQAKHLEMISGVAWVDNGPAPAFGTVAYLFGTGHIAIPLPRA